MYFYRRKDWARFVVQPLRSIRRDVFLQSGVVFLISIYCFVANRMGTPTGIPVGYHEVGGVLVAITLGFRANSAYARFWEARTIWGGLVNASRNLQRLISEYAGESAGREAAAWVSLFAHAVRRRLREESVEPEASRLLENKDLAAACYANHHPPLFISHHLSSLISKSTTEMTPFFAQLAERQLSALVDCLGGLERIRRTPTPIGYVVLVRQIVLAFVLSLPFALVNEAGLWTPIIALAVTFPVLAMEALAAELDDPFGHAPNNLPLTFITDNIEKDVTNLKFQKSSTSSFIPWKAGELVD